MTDFFQEAAGGFMKIFYAVFHILWGDFYYYTPAGREFSGNLSSGTDPDPFGDLLYHPDQIPSFPDVSGYDPGGYGKEK